VSVSDAAKAIGKDGWRELDSESVSKVLHGYENLFASFDGRTNATEFHDQSNPDDAGSETHSEGEPVFYIVNTNSRHNPEAWRDMLSAPKAAAYYDRKQACRLPFPDSCWNYCQGENYLSLPKDSL
jgi:hypothetical protein